MLHKILAAAHAYQVVLPKILPPIPCFFILGQDSLLGYFWLRTYTGKIWWQKPFSLHQLSRNGISASYQYSTVFNT